jgi:hypothetical protein
MQDYSKILTERGMISKVSGQETPCENAKSVGAAKVDLRALMLDREYRFGQPHARLFVFLGRKVRTPAGAGTLLQVFADRVTVLLETELSRCAVFTPQEIAPCDWSV